MRVPTMSAGHQVGRELDAGERSADDPGQRLDGERLGHAGHAFEQAVAAGEQRDEHPLDHPVLADDDPLDLEHRPFEHGRVLGRGRAVAPAARSSAAEPASDAGGVGVLGGAGVVGSVTGPPCTAIASRTHQASHDPRAASRPDRPADREAGRRMGHRRDRPDHGQRLARSRRQHPRDTASHAWTRDRNSAPSAWLDSVARGRRGYHSRRRRAASPVVARRPSMSVPSELTVTGSRDVLADRPRSDRRSDGATDRDLLGQGLPPAGGVRS